MNFDNPLEKNLVSNYIKPKHLKLYQRLPENTEKQSRTTDDEENAPYI